MKNSFIFRVMEFMLLIQLGCSSVSCVTWGEFSPERIDKIHEEDKKWNDWSDKYIKSVLYVGMPENEFVRLFAKDASWNDIERPYIINHKNNKYVIVSINRLKYRITFEESLLVKLEAYGWEKIPILTASYRDVSDLLNGYEISEGLYKGMSEDEFLRNFSNQILSRFKNGYEVLSKDGHKRGVEFTDGILSHSWKSD